ncbi:hypothetical protein G6F22_010702 [Rhizopus arrhizus]|nr:hypothetical protein G6F23_010960 [Rhizopus arrhizus]KAG0779320.1 hypothetical protein G6F22_010702 [Rhizopus arrhizus]KAG0958638.1 hypothetical protein G6F31_012320 [Rhizopus arrhizus]KAG1398788.1 hypothetical protein G6F58_011250 [Rhizopus delemar]KAG1408354.1 hypothetical protein G6F59_012232 [Rhizopus arrhizus]
MISSDSKQYKTRQRASSFNHSVTYKPRQRRPSYHVLSKKISTQIINTDTYSLGRTYFTNDSNSEGEDDIENISDYYLYRDTTDIDSNIEDSHNTDIRTFTEGSKITLDSTESSNDSRKSLPKSIEDRPPSLYPPRPIQPSQNKKRDQYGFLKGSQWITEEKFEEFESYYAPIVKRRHEKWKQLLKEHHQQWPPKSIKRYIRKGIPPELRGQAWLHYSGAKSKLESSRGLYEELTKTANELGSKNENLDIIERDLHRTFPENSQFKIDPPLEKKDVPMIQSLKRVLLAFSLYSPSIGYCQSLNYIAGILLLFMSEEEAFWTFVTLITEILPPNIYDVTMEGTNIDQNVLMHLISERHPLVWNKMSPGQSFWACEEQQEGGMPTCSLVTSHWFLTLYINILPIESVLRVWDCLFYEGQTVLFRVALGIFKLNESNILAVDDPLEVFQEIQNMPKRMIDCHQLIESTYQQYAATTRLKDEEIIDRRELFKERRDQRRRNIPVQNGRKLIKRGTVRGAIIHRAKEARWYIERAKSVKNKP